MRSIIDYVEHWAAVQPEKCYSSFLDAAGRETESYTFREFHERTCALAHHLAEHTALRRGDRALLVYPPGLEIVVALVACARMGVIPVPVNPPTRANSQASLARLAVIAENCDATAALTVGEQYRSQHTHALRRLAWIPTDELRAGRAEAFSNDPSPALLLQYTSGSTTDPRGVIVSHQNVLHNCRTTLAGGPAGVPHATNIGVCWLPQYHDMGLIGYYLYPLVVGGTTYGLSPMTFLRKPAVWLQTMSRVRATYASSPNFGFEYCLREDKLPAHELADVDLSSVRVLMSASEHVKADTYRQFLERFGPYGLRAEAHVVAYGLAEHTLTATQGGSNVLRVNTELLRQGLARAETADAPAGKQIRLVSCGRPGRGVRLRIVNPQSRVPLGENQVGEIWLAGRSTSAGYWNRPELTREVFGNTVASATRDRAKYLRTGDLGFLNRGELVVCGRIKDSIIVGGVNYFPQDIEAVVESASPAIRTGGVVAFVGDGESESLIIVAELRNSHDVPDPRHIVEAIRTHGCLEPEVLAFVPPKAITRTTSGKLARASTRQRWLSEELPVIAVHHRPETSPASELLEQLRRVLRPFDLAASEHLSVSLADLGIDSLTLVTLVADFEALLRASNADSLIDKIDGRLLLGLRAGEVLALLDGLEQFEPRASIEALLQQLIEGRAESESKALADDSQLDLQVSVTRADEPGLADEPIRSVLLTGPTGFFGPFLLASLLRKTPYTYYVLTRAPDEAAALERLHAALARAQLLTPALREQLGRRVRVVCGDLTGEDLGLDASRWATLAGSVQAVVHNAALVNYVLNYAGLRPHNVEGTRQLLRFAFTGTRKDFHLISSTTVFGWTPQAELRETDNNAERLNLDFGYAQSKWVAEQLVLGAERDGLRVRIYRPAFLSASSTGVGSADDIAIRMLTFMINHGLAVNAQNQISFVPVDIAANNIAAVFAQRDLEFRTLHVTADAYYSMPDVTRMITSEYGYDFAYYDIPQFVAAMRRSCRPEEPLYPLLDFVSRSHVKVEKMHAKRYRNEQYRRARQAAPGTCADPTLRETVSYLMTYMLTQGLIRAPGAAQ